MTKKIIKILAIDDHVDNLEMLKALISDGFPNAHFLSAGSGGEGYELCQLEKPDIVLLDIIMPGMDGYDVCSKIKSDISLRHIPVIMVMANRADRDSRIRALEAGADAFLPKPVDESELRAQIRTMLRNKESEDQKKEEKQRLEDIVLDRTKSLEQELSDRKMAENKLILSLDKITKNRQAIMNLMEDLRIEMGERKHVEEKLKIERNLLRTLIDNLPDTIYILDKEGRKVIANRTDLKNIGFSSEADVIGKNDLELFPGEIGARGHADNMSVINTATPIIDREEYFIDEYDNLKWLLTSKYPLYDTDGKVNGLFGTGHDITNRRKAEQELEVKNRELEFLYTISHELSQLSLTDNINEFLAKKLKEYSGAVLAVSLDYIPDQSALQIKHIETNQTILNKIAKILGRTFFEKTTPVSPENINFILHESFAGSDSLNELSFGQISEFTDKAIKSVTGIDRYYAIANVFRNEYFGTTMLGFRKGTVAPRKELLVSFARVAAATIQRRHYEEKLKESEEQYRLLIQNQGEGVGVVDLNETFVLVNPAAEEMFGVGKGGLLHRNLLDFIDNEHKAIVERETNQRSKAEKSTYEIDIIRPSGERRTILITATPQFSKNGKLSGTFGVFRDITERKKMEQKIIESEAYYRTLIDISPDGIIVTNIEGNVVYASKKAYEIFGVPSGENVIGTSIVKGLAPENQQAVMQNVINNLKGKVIPETREIKLQKFDGTIFWGELSSSPLSDLSGNPIALMIICRDITDRKLAESELIRSKEKAEESDRLKTAFLHNISHEIRTPMNAIIGFSALLNEPELDKESQNSYTEIITQSSNHLLSIVSDIIEISNIEAGILKLNVKKTNLNGLLRNIHTQFMGKATEKNLEFSINTCLKDSESQIWTDESKLTQVLSSLVNNAVKFTARGNISLGCSMKERFIEFYVRDTGIGISDDQFEKIFDRFYQVESTIARQYEGTGLGLSIAKAYVELLGGSIWLTSEPGNGSTFFFTIPYNEAEISVRNEPKVIEKGFARRYDNKTVLIAEDEENNYRLVVELLSGLNLTIIHAENGREAVDKCSAGNEIDLVLMDIKMPVMDGYEATSILKKLKPSLPIIAQTAFAFESDKEKVFKAGCDDYISKPIKKELLIEMVKKYLQD